MVCKSRIRGAGKKRLHLIEFVEGLLAIVDIKVTTDGVRFRELESEFQILGAAIPKLRVPSEMWTNKDH